MQPINTPTWVLERNPFYWAVDTDGNQLPYIDRVQLTLAENLEVLNLRAVAGEYDLQERHIDIAKLPVILENQEKGGYTVHLDQAYNGSDSVLQINQSLRRRSRNREVADQRRLPPRAVAGSRPQPAQRDLLARRRHTGLGRAGGELALQSGPRVSHHLVDPRRRQGQRDARCARPDQEGRDGFRVRTDNGERLRIEITATQAFLPYPKQAEMIAQQWRKIGIAAEVKENERNLAMTRIRNNEHHIFMWTNGGTELLYLFPRHAIPVDPTEAYMGPLFAQWYASNGRQGKEPDRPEPAEDLPAVPRARRASRRRSGSRRPRRSGRSWPTSNTAIGTVGQSPGLHGRTAGQQQAGQYPLAGVHRPALPHAGRFAS